MTVVAINDVSNLFDGGLPGSTYEGQFRIGVQDLGSQDNTGLFLPLPKKHISDLDFTGSEILLSEQVTGESTDANGVLVVPIASVGIDDCTFVAFDQERYQVQYSNKTIAQIDSSQVVITSNTLTINGLTFSQSNVKVNVTVAKSNIKNKVKNFQKSETIDVTYSNNEGSGTTAGQTLNFRLFRIGESTFKMNLCYSDGASVGSPSRFGRAVSKIQFTEIST